LKEKEKENKKDNEESKSKAEVPKEADEQYDEAALKEIESFLASTVREKKDSERGDSAKTAAAGETKGKGAAASADADEDEDDLAVVWEDEEEKAKREAAEAEERRRKRQEIASKYSAGSVPTSPVASRSSALSPGSATRKRAHTAPEPMEKATILTVESSSAGVENGSSSISVPTASIHLSKLALGSEEGSAEAEAHDAVHEPLVGSAVAAAVRAVLPAADKPAAGSSDQTAPAAVVTEQDAEGRQLEAEKSALELEERREQRGASKGYGGGYGAGGRVEFDMFSASPSGIEHQLGRKGYIGANGKYADTGVGGRRAMREALLDGEPHGVVAEGEDPLLQSNWDDGEGYYKARIGELVGDRFQILGVVGKGVFATVLKCVDLRAGDGTTNVAVKMIRNNDTMRKAAEKEKSILLSIVEHDPDNKKFCVRLLTHLEYRNHVALVFEYQSMNLRETLKKFGKDVGINIGAVRMYGRQLFVALKHLMDLRIVHADIKLDNILCSADLKQVRLYQVHLVALTVF
jgi:serine/threonine-protein kinase PRP4